MKPGKELLCCFHQMRFLGFVPDRKFWFFSPYPHRLLVLVIGGKDDCIVCRLGSGRLLSLLAAAVDVRLVSGFLFVFLFGTVVWRLDFNNHVRLVGRIYKNVASPILKAAADDIERNVVAANILQKDAFGCRHPVIVRRRTRACGLLRLGLLRAEGYKANSQQDGERQHHADGSQQRTFHEKTPQRGCNQVNQLYQSA